MPSGSTVTSWAMRCTRRAPAPITECWRNLGRVRNPLCALGQICAVVKAVSSPVSISHANHGSKTMVPSLHSYFYVKCYAAFSFCLFLDLLNEDKTINRRALGGKVFGNQVIGQMYNTWNKPLSTDRSSKVLGFFFYAGAVKSPNRHCVAGDRTSGGEKNQPSQRGRYSMNLLNLLILELSMYSRK